MENLTFRTRCTSYTDNGPACHKCRGTLYGYEPHADETITAWCWSCHAKGDTIQTRDAHALQSSEDWPTVMELTAVHRTHAARRKAIVTPQVNALPGMTPLGLPK